jgi:hypothetical protein
MRFALIRLAADRHRLLISNHHLLMDGWSAPILVRELLEVYAQHGSAASLPRVTPYRDYLTLHRPAGPCGGTCGVAEALAGLEEGTRLAPRQAGREPLAPEQIVLSLDPALSAFAQSRRARAGADAQHRDADRVGHPARPAERPRRRGVRRDGWRAGRRSLPASSTWWGCSSTRCRCGCGCRRSFRCRRCCGRPRTASRG